MAQNKQRREEIFARKRRETATLENFIQQRNKLLVDSRCVQDAWGQISHLYPMLYQAEQSHYSKLPRKQAKAKISEVVSDCARRLIALAKTLTKTGFLARLDEIKPIDDAEEQAIDLLQTAALGKCKEVAQFLLEVIETGGLLPVDLCARLESLRFKVLRIDQSKPETKTTASAQPRAREKGSTEAAVTDASQCWSRPVNQTILAKIMAISPRTVKRQIDEGQLTIQNLSERSFQVLLDDQFVGKVREKLMPKE